MGIYQSALIIALVIAGLAVALALIPELLQRLPHRYRRRPREEYHVKLREEELQVRARPNLKRESRPDGAPPADPS